MPPSPKAETLGRIGTGPKADCLLNFRFADPLTAQALTGPDGRGACPGLATEVLVRPMRRLLSLLSLKRTGLWLGLASLMLVSAADAKRPVPRWCAPEAEEVQEGVCFFEPESSKDESKGGHSRTLVLFLHTLVGANSDWQWQQQRVMMEASRSEGFAVLMPRGRKGIGPKRSPDVWAWPTAPRLQEELEPELLEEWAESRALVEHQLGRRFERFLIFGFSNGAYFATTLALRDRIQADGYGVFAGGAGGKYSWVLGHRTERRAPIFVGYGTKDPSQNDMRSLARTLKTLGWRYRVKSQPIGHMVTQSQLRAAVNFLAANEVSTTASKAGSRKHARVIGERRVSQ